MAPRFARQEGARQEGRGAKRYSSQRQRNIPDSAQISYQGSVLDAGAQFFDPTGNNCQCKHEKDKNSLFLRSIKEVPLWVGKKASVARSNSVVFSIFISELLIYYTIM